MDPRQGLAVLGLGLGLGLTVVRIWTIRVLEGRNNVDEGTS